MGVQVHDSWSQSARLRPRSHEARQVGSAVVRRFWLASAYQMSNVAVRMSSPENMWVKFFTEAGLPSGISATYALTFTENRIQMNMLLDLTKDYLREMGIVCLGDVIAILRHAKHVHEMTARDRVLGKSSIRTPIVPPPPKLESQPIVTTVKTAPKRAISPVKLTPVAQIENAADKVDKANGIGAKRKVISRSLPSSKSEDNNEEVNQGVSDLKIRRLSWQQNDVHITNKKTADVFSRLGSTDETKTKPLACLTIKKSTDTQPKNIFARLGGKEPAAPTTDNLKLIPKNITLSPKLNNIPKKLIINSTGNIRIMRKVPMIGTMQADRIPVSIKEKLPLSAPPSPKKTVKFSPHVDYKLIEKRTEKEHPAKVAFADVRATLMKNVTPFKTDNVKLRLGISTKPVIVKKIGVFSRLGSGMHRRTI